MEDSLVLLLNLLKNNVSNQNFFKEGSFIKRLTSFFDLETSSVSGDDGGWSAQKVTNIHLMLQVRRKRSFCFLLVLFYALSSLSIDSFIFNTMDTTFSLIISSIILFGIL